MCEILIKAVDAVHPDAAVDARGCYKRGDAVVVMPDRHPWGGAELDLNKFYIIKLPGVDPALLGKYLEEEYEVDATGAFVLDEDGGKKTVRRRRFWGQNSPPEWRTLLAAEGKITKSWEEVAPYIWDKKTGQNEAGKPLA